MKAEKHTMVATAYGLVATTGLSMTKKAYIAPMTDPVTRCTLLAMVASTCKHAAGMTSITGALQAALDEYCSAENKKQKKKQKKERGRRRRQRKGKGEEGEEDEKMKCNMQQSDTICPETLAAMWQNTAGQ